MKRVAAFVLSLLIMAAFCGCSLKDTKNAIDNIAQKAGLSNETGTVVSYKVNGSEVKTITPANENNIGRFADCYYALDDTQKALYRYFLTAANERVEGWFSCGKAGEYFENDITAAYKAMLCDNPQIFWMPSNYVITKVKDNLCVAFCIDDDETKIDFLLKKDEIDTAAARLERAVDSVVSEAEILSSDYEKELFVHDRLCKNCKYDLSGGDMIYSSYGALVDGVCVCEGYSRAMQLCLLRMGIDCCLVYGEFEDVGHMWNKVKIEGSWYNVDITWDAHEKHGALHQYFNVTDDEIKRDHIVLDLFDKEKDYKEELGFNLLNYAATSRQYNFFSVGNRYLTDSASDTADAIQREIEAGKPFAELLDITTGDMSEILNSAAYILRDKAKLTSYSKIRDEVIVFFENTY